MIAGADNRATFVNHYSQLFPVLKVHETHTKRVWKPIIITTPVVIRCQIAIKDKTLGRIKPLANGRPSEANRATKFGEGSGPARGWFRVGRERSSAALVHTEILSPFPCPKLPLESLWTYANKIADMGLLEARQPMGRQGNFSGAGSLHSMQCVLWQWGHIL